MQPLTEFHIFPHLPEEVRYLVWKYLMPPRIVYLHSCKLKQRSCYRVWSDRANDDKGNDSFFDEDPYRTADDPDPDDHEKYPRTESGELPHIFYEDKQRRSEEQGNIEEMFGFRAVQNPLNSLLLVCKETREIFTATHTQAFGSKYAFPETWFDFKRDTLLLELPDHAYRDSNEAQFFPDALSTDDVPKVRYLALNEQRILDFDALKESTIMVFPNLLEVTIIEDQHGSSYRGQSELDLTLVDFNPLPLWGSLYHFNRWEVYKNRYCPKTHRRRIEEYDPNCRDRKFSWGGDSDSEDTHEEASYEKVSSDEESNQEDTGKDPEKDSAEEDSAEEDSTEWDSAEEDSTEWDFTDEDSTEWDFADEDSTDEDSTEEDSTEEAANALDAILRNSNCGPYAVERLVNLWTGSVPKLPPISVAQLALRSQLNAYEADKKRYFQEKEDFRNTISLQCRGKKTLRLVLREDVTVEEMVVMARDEWKIPGERACEGVFDENHLQISLKSLVDEEVWQDAPRWQIEFGGKNKNF
jgi:hypothetical protein